MATLPEPGRAVNEGKTGGAETSCKTVEKTLDSVVNLLLIFAMVCYPPRNGGRLCTPHIIVTTYPTGFGNFWNRICLDAKALVA